MAAFEVKIKLGNDAMKTPEDVADALTTIADRVVLGETSGKIRDANGNTVGRYTYDEDAA